MPVSDVMTAPVDAADDAEHRRILVILAALMLGTALAALDQTIVATALPTIAGDLHGLNHLSWVVTAYLLATCISTPVWGKLGDLYGRKSLFQLAILIFLAGSMLSGLSQSMVELIAFRAIQGIGAGGLMVGAQAIMGDVVPARQRGRYLGYFGVVFGVTNVAGPLLGGWFTEHLSWRWIFYINVPLGIVALFVVATVLHIPVKRVPHKIDWAGTSFLSVGVTCIILLTTWAGSEYAWGSPTIIVLGLISLMTLVVFCWIETRASEPIIPLWLFKNRTFTATSAVGFIIGFAMFGAIIYLPLYLQIVHGASPTLSGLELLPMIGGMLLTFILSGRLVTSTGRYKIFPILGTAVLAVGLFLLTQLGTHTPYGEVAVFMFITGLGVGFVMQVLVVAVQNSVPHSELGVATATSTFFRTIGGAFGVAVLGAVFGNQLISQLRLHATAAELKLINGSNLTENPAQINHLPSAQRTFVIDAFSHSVERAFLVAVPFVVLGFLLSWLIKEIPLRTTAFVATTGPDGEQPPGEGTNGNSAVVDHVSAQSEPEDDKVLARPSPTERLRSATMQPDATRGTRHP
jgi:EmrB/QacA subfamily drug resistance transporter